MNTANTRYETQKHEDPHKFVVLDHKREEAKVAELQGHWVYLRMTERDEKVGDIYLPEKSRDENITIYEVIAIGKDVHKHRPMSQRFKDVIEMDRDANLDIEVGDIVIIPEKATGEGTGYSYFVKPSPLSPYECSIDKGLILAVVG